MLKIILAAFLILVSNVSYAQETKLTNVGYAAFNLTANRFNCAGLKLASKDLTELHISFLYNTFGNNFDCLKTFLEDTRLKTLQIHLINEPGHRNKRLGSYEFLYSIKTPSAFNTLVRNKDLNLKNRFVQYVNPLKVFLEQNLKSHTELIINPGLESNLSDSSGKILIDWTREIFPNTRIVWNPLRKTSNSLRVAGGDFLEVHGLFPSVDAPCIFNLDGSDVSFPFRPALGETSHSEGQNKNWIQSGPPVFQLYEQMANTCEVVFFWSAESNALDYRKSFVDPRKRANKISTSTYSRIFREIYSLHNNGVVYPTNYQYTDDDNFIVSSCSEVRTNFVDGFKSGRLLKQSEFRNRGAVLLLPREFDSVSSAKLYKGRTIVDDYKKVGRYKDGRNMFRSSKSPTNYPIGTYLVLDKKSSKICYKIPNPRVRLD